MPRTILTLCLLAASAGAGAAAPTSRAPSPIEARAIYCLAALTAERQDLDSALADKLEDQTRGVLQESRTGVLTLQQRFSAFLTPLSGALNSAAVAALAQKGARDEAGTTESNAAVAKCDQTKPEFQQCLAATLGPVLGRLRECHNPSWLPATPEAP